MNPDSIFKLLIASCSSSFMIGAMQGQTTWTVEDEIAEWGSGGTYTLNGVSTSGGTGGKSTRGGPGSNLALATQSTAGHGYGLMDGIGALFGPGYQDQGQTTIVDPTTNIDLSTPGATFTQQFHYSMAAYWRDGVSPTGDNHAYEFGLISDTGGRFGDGTDALWFGAKEHSVVDGGAPYMQSMQVDLQYFSDTSDSDQTDWNYVYTPDGTVTTNLPLDAYDVALSTANPATSATSHLYQVMYENVSATEFDVTIGIVGIDGGNFDAGSSILSSTILYQGTTRVTHNLDAASLSSLYPAIGTFKNDSHTPQTGATFDWEDEYTQIMVLPEPSSALLAAMGVFGFVFRRRR